jgi:murein DD-endopeptidase MepM/ murein hydrolase activator NlpD
MDVDYVRPCKTREVRDNFDDHVKRHSKMPGLDYACNTGDKVFATAKGTIVSCSNNPDQVLGKNIAIRHPDGKHSYYLHLSKLNVRNGQRVIGGEVIGLSGNTGTTSTGPHLHFAIKNARGVFIDPKKLLRKEIAEKRAEAAAIVPPVVDVVAEVIPE